MAVHGHFLIRFFPFLIYVYFILAMSLRAVSLDEQAKYNSFRGALTDLLNDTSLTTSFIWLDGSQRVCSPWCYSESF